MNKPLTCPHCRQYARVRSSRALTPTYRQIYFQCTNLDCGHTFGGELTYTHTISPSRCPDPSVHLRMTPPRHPVANDNPDASIAPVCGPEVPPLPAANDDDPLGEAVSTGG